MIQKRLFELKDEVYAAFHAKLIPTVDPELVIGVRVPVLRKLAKQCIQEFDYESFLQELPHKYYDENMLHALIISEVKDYERCVSLLDEFLPYVDNWAVCDTILPKVFKKHKEELVGKVYEWSHSKQTYICRFGIGTLMRYFLDEDFKPEYLELVAQVRSEEYYVNMMIAWFMATALAKQWSDTIPYIREHRLSHWVHNKTIQKAVESYRITDEQKEDLRTLKECS